MRIRLIVAIALPVAAIMCAFGALHSGSGLAQTLQLPCRFYGTVQTDCYPVPDGTVVTAEVNGDTYADTTTGAIYADSRYDILIVPPEGTSYDDGTLVYFTIGDRDALQIGRWEAGGNVRIDLTDWCVRTRVDSVFVSDPSTLAAGSIDGITYGPYQPAVAAFVFDIHPKVDGATWISNMHKTGLPYTATWRKFQRRFTLEVPNEATNLSGTLEIAGDNLYTAYFNGVVVGSDSDVLSVETWPVSPVDSVNTLEIVVKNEGVKPGDSFFGNPTGVIYRLTLGYDMPPDSIPTPSPAYTPTPSPAPTPSLVPTPTPHESPSLTPTRTPPPPAGGDGSVDSSKVIGVVFFSFVDILLIGLFLYLVWRFFIHPRAPQP